jgi:prophage DNA circulation protein
MTKVPVNFRIDSELLALSKAQAAREGMTLIALLERSLKAELGISASEARSNEISVEALVETVVKTVKTDIEQVRVNITSVETFVKIITESVNTIKAEVAGLSDKLNLVSATVDTIVNTSAVNTIVESTVNTDKSVDSSTTSTASSHHDWVNLATVAAQLGVLPKSISGACTRRGRDIGNDTIEFEVAGVKIRKRGKGTTARYLLDHSF